MKVAGIHLDNPLKNSLDPEPEEPIGLEYVLASVQHDGHDVALFLHWHEDADLLKQFKDFDPATSTVSCRVFTEKGCRRILVTAFDYAKKFGYPTVTVIHKANVIL